MRALHAAVTAVLIFIAASPAVAQCVSETRVISTRRSVPNLVVGPIAFGGGVLAVAKLDRSNDRIFVATYDESFNPLSGDVLVASDVAGEPLRMVWNGSEFALFYRSDVPARLVLQHINTDGQPTAAPINVTPRSFDLRDEMDVAWNAGPGEYVVANTDQAVGSRFLWITVLTPAGVVRRDVNTFVYAANENPSPNVAIAANGTVAVFFLGGDETITWARLEPNGVRVNYAWTGGRNLRVTAVGNHFHLVKQSVIPGGSQIRWMAIDTAGTTVVSDRVLVTPTGSNVLPLALTTNGQELALSYLDFDFGPADTPGRLRLLRFTPGGTVISDSHFSIDPLWIYAFSDHEFVWTGSSYITPAVYEFNPELTSFLIRVCPLQARILAPQMVVRNEFATFTAQGSGGTPGYTYRWNPGDVVETFGGRTFTYRYRNAGTYTVTLTVTDNEGVVATTTYTVRVVARKRRAARH